MKRFDWVAKVMPFATYGRRVAYRSCRLLTALLTPESRDWMDTGPQWPTSPGTLDRLHVGPSTSRGAAVNNIMGCLQAIVNSAQVTS